MSASCAAAGVFGEGRAGENVLPDPFAMGVGVFHFEGVRKEHASVAGGQIILVDELDVAQMPFEGVDERVGQDGDAVLEALSIADDNLMLAEIQVLPPRAAGLRLRAGGRTPSSVIRFHKGCLP